MNIVATRGPRLSHALTRLLSSSSSVTASLPRRARRPLARSLIGPLEPLLSAKSSSMPARAAAGPQSTARSTGKDVSDTDKEFHVVVWGATGFVGKLVCEELASKYSRVSPTMSSSMRAQPPRLINAPPSPGRVPGPASVLGAC